MKIEWVIMKARNAVAVIPTMDVDSQRVRLLVNELDHAGVDSLLVEDRLPEFSFSRSMNRGIEQALGRNPKPDIIILSNDDIFDIKGLDDMMEYVHINGGYAQPYVNGKRCSFVVTRSRIGYIFRYAVKRLAPFYALRHIRLFHARIGSNYPAPAILHGKHEIVCVQPFGVFKSESLETVKFNEEIVNGMEDDQFGYSLHVIHGFRGVTKREWNVHHSRGSSFRGKTRRMKASIYGSDEQFRRNFFIFDATVRMWKNRRT